MALKSRSPELLLTESVQETVSVSTGPSLELCTLPSSLGSSVATAALEQLFAMEKSLQNDYFKCNEEARTFLKDIAATVKKLGQSGEFSSFDVKMLKEDTQWGKKIDLENEEMRKKAIDLLEIESMELSRMYYILETMPYNIHRELEECIRNARKVNISEINQLHTKLTDQSSEIQNLKKRILELNEVNDSLGEKQEKLAIEHEKIVIAFNHIMKQKAETIVFINETHTKVNKEKEEIECQKKGILRMEEDIEKQKVEYSKKKQELTDKLYEYNRHHEQQKIETYKMKKTLERLMRKMSRIKETVATGSVVRSDHNLEIARLQEMVRHWKTEVDSLLRFCNNMEDKVNFFVTNKGKMVDTVSSEKNDLLDQIKLMTEKLSNAKLENTNLQKKLRTVIRQYRLVLREEEKSRTQKQKADDENQKHLLFIAEKENFLVKRKVDIRNMEEGLVTLSELLRATKELCRKQIKILSDNLQRESQRCVLTKWKIKCLEKQHTRWLLTERSSINSLTRRIHIAEQRRLVLLNETSLREREINQFLEEIEAITTQIKQDVEEFVVKEKKLIHTLSRFKVRYVQEAETTKLKEEELVHYLPVLHEAEEEFTDKNQKFIDLGDTMLALKQEKKYLTDSITACTKDFSRYFDSVGKMKEELRTLRQEESIKNQEHIEALKNLENEIYEEDMKTNILFLENEKLRKYIEHTKRNIDYYIQQQEESSSISSDKYTLMMNEQAHYMTLWDEYQFTVKELVSSGDEVLQELKILTERLHLRDAKIEQIRACLQEHLDRLLYFASEEAEATPSPKPPTSSKKKKHPKNVRFHRTCRNTSVDLTK